MLPEGYIQSNYWPDDYWHEDYFPVFGVMAWYKIALEGHDADFLNVTATSLTSTDGIYLGSKDSGGTYLDGSWRIIINGSGELSKDKKVAGVWTTVTIDDV